MSGNPLGPAFYQPADCFNGFLDDVPDCAQVSPTPAPLGHAHAAQLVLFGFDSLTDAQAADELGRLTQGMMPAEQTRFLASLICVAEALRCGQDQISCTSDQGEAARLLVQSLRQINARPRLQNVSSGVPAQTTPVGLMQDMSALVGLLQSTQTQRALLNAAVGLSGPVSDPAGRSFESLHLIEDLRRRMAALSVLLADFSPNDSSVCVQEA